mmetsp:Transcript_47145/g.123707  ORF Transcript_47145/g.123707 Transcript_47145/m.123707 type:complete len:274 (-) Transcript_47145:40-861(-)
MFERRRIRHSRHLDDPLYLVDRRRTREQRLANKHLSDDAPHRPHVDRTRVRGGSEQDLRGAVPTGGHVVRQRGRGLIHRLDLVQRARKPKVSNLEDAVLIEQQIRRLQVPMQHAGGVAVLEGLQRLVDNELLVHWLEDIGPHHRVQVGLHEVEDEVDILIVVCLVEVAQLDDVGVSDPAAGWFGRGAITTVEDLHALKHQQVRDLAEGTLRISLVLKCVKDLLDRDDLLGFLVDRLEDDGVGTLAEFLLNIVLSSDVLVHSLHLINLVAHTAG